MWSRFNHVGNWLTKDLNEVVFGSQLLFFKCVVTYLYVKWIESKIKLANKVLEIFVSQPHFSDRPSKFIGYQIRNDQQWQYFSWMETELNRPSVADSMPVSVPLNSLSMLQVLVLSIFDCSVPIWGQNRDNLSTSWTRSCTVSIHEEELWQPDLLHVLTSKWVFAVQGLEVFKL